MLRSETLRPKIKALSLTLALLFALPAAAEETERFDIQRFEVTGNSLLPQAAVDATVAPFTGKARDYADVQRALEALELKYREAGYGAVLVHVPEQELTHGVVKLQVIEARLYLVNVSYTTPEAKEWFPEANVRAALPALKEGGTPNTPKIAENIQLANENPARQLEVVLKAAEDPGQIDADVNVTATNPKKAFATFDNTGSESTGKHRIGIGLQHGNLLNRDHVGTLNYTTSPEKPSQVSLWSLSYRVPLYTTGDSLDFIGAHSDVNAGTTVIVSGPLTFSGKGDVLGARYNWLLPRHGEYTQRMVFALDYRAFDNTCTLGTFGAAGCGPSGVDVTVHPLSITYGGVLTKPRQAWDGSVTVSRNLPGGKNGHEAEFNATRPASAGAAFGGAPADFLVTKFNGSYTQALERDVQLRAAFAAQYTRDPLISAEQFGLAGSTTVRGFAERQTSRDIGYAVNLEAYSPNYAPKLNFAGSSLRVVAFYDQSGGYNNALPGDARQRTRLASVGLGARATWEKSLQLKLDAAYVLDGGDLRPKGDTRGHLSAYYAF